MGIISWIIPQEKQFFVMLEKQSANVLLGVSELVRMMENYDNREEIRKKIKSIENAGDMMVHEIFDELNKTFITPIDREDISAMTCALDDILDLMESVAEGLVIYKVDEPPKYMPEMAETLQRAAENVHEAMKCLSDFKNARKIKEYCMQVHTMENEGDALLRKAVADLFEGSSAIEIIKYKELYENIEAAIDKCEDAADVLQDILVKYA